MSPINRGKAKSIPMGTVSIEFITSWSHILRRIVEVLKSKGYPDAFDVRGGQGNICAFYTTKHKALCYRNEGSGGQHSEPAVLQHVQKRQIQAGDHVVLFTERAPCRNCRDSIQLRADEWKCDIYVYYLVNWTDTDDSYDVISGNADAQTADDARRAVATRRNEFRQRHG